MCSLHRSSDFERRLAEAERIWRSNRCIAAPCIVGYRLWIRRFARYCQLHGLDERSELTREGAERFARWWRAKGSPRRRGQLQHAIDGSRSALRAWAFARSVLGEALPLWQPPPCMPSKSAVLGEFAAYLREVRGSPPGTIRGQLAHVARFEAHRRRYAVSRRSVRLRDIDRFIIDCRCRYARKTVAGICSSLRSYLRFLHVTGRVHVDLAAAVLSPLVRVSEQPHRALPWRDVQRILRAVDRSNPCGRRDYALLLMMSAYGLGAGEAIGLRLDDIDWQARTVRVRRPKNGNVFLLPLLPAVARALASYLRHGRPRLTPSRQLFVTMRAPHKSLGGSVTVRHILHSAARRAGVSAPFLGTHVLRHTHACRQLELGTPTKLIGDILGHRDPESTSAYLRVATERLRALSLPVPT